MRAIIASFFAASLVACGGSVSSGDPGSGPATSTGGTDSGSGSSDGGVAPDEGIVTETGLGETSVDSGAICGETHDSVSIDVTMPNGDEYKCWSTAETGGPLPATIYAQIVDVTADTLTVDTCPPNADCIASLAKIQVVAAGLDLRAIPKSSYVTIAVRFLPSSWVCKQSIVVESAAEWGGLPNPVDAGGHTYLVAADSTWETTSASLKVEPIAQGCLPGVKTCGGPGLGADDYELRFTTPTTHVDTYMGEDVPGPIPIAPGDGVFVRNLRSYQDATCDAYWNYAFWAVFRGL